MRRVIPWLSVPLLGLVFLALPLGAEEHPKGPHLRYMSSYESAMLEARLRGVPIFFSRHKDF